VTVGTIRVGVSGWRYAPWRGVFYPTGLPQHAELAYAASAFPTIEINGSFYSLQLPKSWRTWYESVPCDFQFAIKGPRYLTHMLKIRGIEQPLANFFASGVFELREKLGPILWQFPASFPFIFERFEAFFGRLPHDLTAAARLARKHGAFMRGRAVVEIDQNRAIRYAVEVRHQSFGCERFVRLLARYGIALVVAEGAGRWPLWQDVTSDFVYMRLHGEKILYRSGYSDAALDRWSRAILAYARGGIPKKGERIMPKARPAKRARDVYCYLDNTDLKLRAPFDARTLMEKLKIQR
jgi:uncharacterized protein YecE (DUF72 family)